MRARAVIACLGLLLWVVPTSAQQAPVVYTFKISAAPALLPKLKPKKIERVLASASRLLTVKNQCPVTFKLDYPNPIMPLPEGTPTQIGSEDQLEAVHRVTACGSTPNCYDVKFVESISFCKTTKPGYVGCAWRHPGYGPKTVIMVYSGDTADIRHIAWAHEFGHTTGLQHRNDSSAALMTHCAMDGRTVRITPDECKCFRAGPGNNLLECSKPDPNLTCPSGD